MRAIVAYLMAAIRPAPRLCAFHGLTHQCWRERRLGVGF